MTAIEGIPGKSRSSSPERAFPSSSESSEDGEFCRRGPRIPDLANYDFAVFQRSMKVTRISAADSDDSMADEAIRMSYVSVGVKRSRMEPETEEDDARAPDFGKSDFQTTPVQSRSGPMVAENGHNSMCSVKHGGGGEGSPVANEKKETCEVGVVFPKKQRYLLGAETSTRKTVVLIRRKDCEKFLLELKAAVGAVEWSAYERRLEVKAVPNPDGDGGGAIVRNNMKRTSNDDADSTDAVSDDGFNSEAELGSVQANAADLRRAIEVMEAQLPKLPKVNKYLKSAGVQASDAPASPSAESVGAGCTAVSSSSARETLRPEIFDFLLKAIQSLQSLASGVLEEGSKLDLTPVLDRARIETASESNELSPAGVEAIFEELCAHLARVDHQAKFSMDVKQALMPVSNGFTPFLSSMMDGVQAAKMTEITSAMKNNERQLDCLRCKLENFRSDLQSTLCDVANMPEPNESSFTSRSSKSGKTSRALSELGKENTRLRKVVGAKDSLIRDLRRELESVKELQSKTKGEIMASVEKLCADFMEQEKEKFKKEKEQLKEKLRRETEAELNAEAMAMSKHYDKRLSVERGLIEAHFRQEARKKESEIKGEMLADFSRRWENALNRADERQIELEDMFKDHLEKKRKIWKNKLQRAKESERRLYEAKIAAIRREFAKTLAMMGVRESTTEELQSSPTIFDAIEDAIVELPPSAKLAAIESSAVEIAEKEVQAKPSMVSVEVQEQPDHDDAMNQTSLTLLLPAEDSVSVSDDSDLMIAELRQQLHDCSVELDLLDQENSTLIEEYSKLRAKFLASEEGNDYLVQRLENLKAIIEDKDDELKEIALALEENFQLQLKEQETKLREDLQQQLVAHVQGVEDAILDRYQKTIRKHSSLLRKKFANVKQNYKTKMDRKMQQLSAKWEKFLTKEKKQIADAQEDALVDVERRLRSEFQQKLDEEMKGLESQANARLARVMEAAEEAKVAETLGVLRKMKQQLEDEHAANLEAKLAQQQAEFEQIKAAEMMELETAKRRELEQKVAQIQRTKELELQQLGKITAAELADLKLAADKELADFKSAKEKELAEFSITKEKEIYDLKMETEKAAITRTLKTITEDFLQPFPISTLAASVKLLALKQLKCPEEGRQQGLASLIDFLKMSHLQAGCLPFTLHSPIRAILSAAGQEELPEDIRAAASSPEMTDNPLQLTTLAKNISKEMKRKLEKELAKQKEKMRQELLQEFKESELNLMNGKMLEKMRKYVQAKVEERLLSEKELFEERLSIERQAFEERLAAEKQAWKRRSSEVWGARLKELGDLLTQKLKQQGGIRVLTDTPGTSVFAVDDAGQLFSSDATSAPEYKSSSFSAHAGSNSNDQANQREGRKIIASSDSQISSIAEVFNDIKKLLMALRVAKDAHVEKEEKSSGGGLLEKGTSNKEDAKPEVEERSEKQETVTYSVQTLLDRDVSMNNEAQQKPPSSSRNPDLLPSSSSLSLFLGRSRYPGRISDDSSELLRRRFKIGTSEEETDSPVTFSSTFRKDLLFVDDLLPRERRKFDWEKPFTPLSSDLEFDFRRPTYSRYPEFDFSPVETP